MVAPRTLVVVLFILLLLTALTVGVSFLEIPGDWHLAAGVAIAAAKASLVLLFFMHVIYSPAATRAVIVVGVFWLIAVLMTLIMTDFAARGSNPLAPGH